MSSAEKSGNFACEKCRFSASTKYRLRRHVNAVHDKIKSFACSFCTYITPYGWHLKSHVKKHHGSARNLTTDPRNKKVDSSEYCNNENQSQGHTAGTF